MKKILFKRNRNNKRGFVFAILDFWSILFFVVAIVILLIYINFAKNNDKEEIDTNIIGINFPHYFMNIFQSEKISLSEYNSDCTITQEITRVEALQYLAENDMIDRTNNCFKALKDSVKLDETFLGTKDTSVLGISKFRCHIIYAGEAFFLAEATQDKSLPLPNSFLLEIPLLNDNLEMLVSYDD